MTDKFHESIDRLADAVSEINLIKHERRARLPLGADPFRFASEVMRLIVQKIIAGFNVARARARAQTNADDVEIAGYVREIPSFGLSYLVGALTGSLTNLVLA